MRAAHMKMLIQWREDVVRRGDRRFVAFNGKVYEKSLTRTCLGCHNKAGFCDRCHAYSGVSGPYCWNCHSDPQTVALSTVRSTP
jgi:RNase P subunit RPR2